MTSFINGYVIEINQYPRFGDKMDLFTVKDYFFYDSNTTEYGYRDTLIPVDLVLGQAPDEDTMRSVINSNIPIMRRVIDLNNQKESWVFETNILEETKK